MEFVLTELLFSLCFLCLAIVMAFFIGGKRTVFGKAFKGCFKDIRPDDLLIQLLRSYNDSDPALWQTGPEDLVVGCAYPEGEQGYNLARMVALGSGLQVPGCTVNRLCASSLEAVAISAGRIGSGWGDCFLVAGVESMSRVPRRGSNFSESEKIKQVASNAYCPNGTTAETVAQKYPHLGRQVQEDFAARCHELADQAFADGKYAAQIVDVGAERDEFIRVPVNREKMASLSPAFSEDGVVTAATSSPLTDGATAGWVVSEAIAKQAGVKNGLEILDAQVDHVSPSEMGMGPVPATQKLLQRNSLSVDDIAAFEINEAFAIQVLASMDELNIPLEKVNTWGGALAIGHPLGASGLRLVMTLHDRLADSDEPNSLGIATLCVGGGQGMSILFKYVQF